jgi:ketosteroid isomerase-like protein
MSQENVEIVRETYARRLLDTPEGHELLANVGFEYVNPPDAVDPGVRRGPDVAAALQGLADAFARTENRLIQVFDGGDSVVVQVRFRGRGAASGADLEQVEAHTWTFASGRIVRFEWGRDLAAALDAVGLSADPQRSTMTSKPP